MKQTLKLNKNYMPLETCTWEEAMTLTCKGNAEMIAEYEENILNAKCDVCNSVLSFNKEKQYFCRICREAKEVSKIAKIKMPAIIRCTKFSQPSKKVEQKISFNRENVYLRDNGQCQYCGKKLSHRQMELEHIVPKSRGGKVLWTNIVCSCTSCNSKKADRTPAEAGMKLLKIPVAPILSSRSKYLYDKMRKTSILHDSWKDYLV